MEEKILNVNNNLARLSKYLNYQISGVVLFLISFLTFGLIFVVAVAAIVFTPFMLYVLYQEKKINWIIFFVVLVVIPFIATSTLLFLGLTSFPWYFIILFLYYLYCFLLRMEVNNWVRARRAKLQYQLEKKRRDDELDAFMSQLDK